MVSSAIMEGKKLQATESVTSGSVFPVFQVTCELLYPILTF